VNITSSPPANNPEFLTYTPTDSSWLITNSAGQEITFTRYDAFGTPALGASASPFGYAGQYVNQATGLYDMRSRSYQPQYGTFTTRDSLFSATDQAFVYAGNDPINSSDPLGQAPVTYPFWAGYAEPGGIGNYEMLFACTNYMSCVADWYLSLKPAYWFYQGIILWFRMRVNGIARPWYWYSHTESGHYQWHGFINTFPYASIVFVDLVLVFEAFSPDQFIATGTQQWHMVKL
jgi:RHS repeat-associated protein